MDSNKNDLPRGFILKSKKYTYCIRNVIGRGGFGITYLATSTVKSGDLEIPMKFAIKEHFLPSDCIRDEVSHHVCSFDPAEERVNESKKDFIAEAKRLKEDIRHPNVVSVVEIFEANNTAYYSMEYIDGVSLRQYIRMGGVLDEKTAVDLMMPIIFAIGYLHDNRITHLDIKPDNIMILGNGQDKYVPILIDFGLSKHYDKKGNPTSTVRLQAVSDGYSPIEQYQGINDFQPTADIYALAATITYCLIGKDPKRCGDIRPGEMLELLKSKLSSSKLEALLNALKPSKFERTDSVRKFLSELAPETDINDWQPNVSVNRTKSIFFNKKKKTSFFSKFNKIFNNNEKGGYKDNTQKLRLPDSGISIYIDLPDSNNLSMDLWFSLTQKYTRHHYYEFWIGNRKVKYDYDCWAHCKDEIRDLISKTRLIENNHWEEEQNVHSPGKGFISITFNYLDGTRYSRENSHVISDSPESYQLYQEIYRLLNAIPDFDREMDEAVVAINNLKKEKLQKNIFLSSMIGMYHGNLTIIECFDWERMSKSQRDEFEPLSIKINIDDKTINISALHHHNLKNGEEILGVLRSYKASYHLEDMDGSKNGECRIMTQDEYFLLKNNLEKLNSTLSFWNVDLFDIYTCFKKENDDTVKGVVRLGSKEFSLRPILEYWGTVQIYSNISYVPGSRNTSYIPQERNTSYIPTTHIPTKPIPFPAIIYGWDKGNIMTERTLQEWSQMIKCDKFMGRIPEIKPLFLKININGKIIDLCAYQHVKVRDYAEVENRIFNTNKQINNEEGSENFNKFSKNGISRLPNKEEMLLILDNYDRINCTLSQWGLEELDSYFWYKDNDLILNTKNAITRYPGLERIPSLRLIIDYWGDIEDTRIFT